MLRPPQVLWSGLPCDNFHLLIACSILVSQRGELIGSDHDFNTILKVSAECVCVYVCVSVCVCCHSVYNSTLCSAAHQRAHHEAGPADRPARSGVHLPAADPVQGRRRGLRRSFTGRASLVPDLLTFPLLPQELSLKVQEVLGLYIPSSSEEDSPDSSQASETQRLLASSPAGASSSSSSSSPAARVPTYP